MQKFQKPLKFFGIFLINTILIVFVLGKISDKSIDQQVFAETTKKYEIYSIEDYITFAESVSEGNEYFDTTVILCSDLDFTGYENIPMIGDMERSCYFYGTFDGSGCELKGLKIQKSEGYAGMFAYLGGTVKNLILRDCTFSGDLVGAVTANSEAVSILNCYIDAQVSGNVSGSIVGSLYGNIYNCVAGSEQYYGELQQGDVKFCYPNGTQDVKTLNDNLTWLSGYVRSNTGYAEHLNFFQWNSSGDSVFIGEDAVLLDQITAKLDVAGRVFELQAYYSHGDQKWSVVMPPAHFEEAAVVTAQFSDGAGKTLDRKHGEEEISFSYEDRDYTVQFLSSDDTTSFFVTLDDGKTLKDVHYEKRYENTGLLTIIEADGKASYETIDVFCGRGNDSWDAAKKGYKLKFKDPVDLLGMGAADNFALLAGYRNDSLMNYVTTTELINEVGFAYAPQFRLVNLYVEGEYVGVYFLAEKVELGKNRIDLDNIYEETKRLNGIFLEQSRMDAWEDPDSWAERHYYHVGKNPEDLTGNYLIEKDVMDFLPEESRFTTGNYVPFVMARAMYSSKEQVDYIADYIQGFEDAVIAEDGINEQGKHYSEYIDMESFAMQWLAYELTEEVSLTSSVYYYKESEVTGDGLLHACYPWDMEYSYIMSEQIYDLWNLTEKAGLVHGYWEDLYAHQDFRDEVYRIWMEKYVPAIEVMIDSEAKITEKGTRNIKWYEERIETMDRLENSRWMRMNPKKRCETNREFLKIREEVLSELLYQ